MGALHHRKIRVLHIASPGPLYGAERWVLALIKALDDTKIESVISVIDDGVNSEAEVCLYSRSLGFETHIFKAPGKFNFQVINDIRCFLILNKIDILHTHWYKPDIIGLIASIGTGCKLISTPHGWSRKPDFKLRIYEILNRLAYLFFDRIVPLSSDINTGLLKLPGLSAKLHLIENGVDLDEIKHSINAIKKHESTDKNGRFVIGYIGQLIYRKGVDVLLKSIANLRNEKIHLIIIGSGSDETMLKSLAEELGIIKNVSFLGFQPDRLSYLRTCDLFVLPSRQEGIPRAVMEAMGMGVPVVVSNIPGCIDLVQDGVNGLIFKVNDHHDLSTSITSLINDQYLRNEIARKGQETIFEKFSSRLMAKRYHELYLNLVSI